MSLKDFEIISKLGSGSFSTVFKVKRLSDGQIYALKQVKMGMLSAKEKENALNEIRILASINNPYIVQFKDCFLDQKTNYLCVILEFCESGDIASQIKEHIKKRTYFKEQLIWEYLIQLLKGLNALHQLTILHRDIKCANIFLSKSQCKLGDLNVSKVSKNNLAGTQIGTPYYAAPEIWKDQKYDGKCDIWSLGCVLYEIATLQPPFKAAGLKELHSKIQAGKYSALPKIYSSDLSDIIGQCLKVRPQLRPTTEQLLNNPIIQQHDKKGQILQGQNVKLSKEQLLATIKFDRNLGALKEKLPKSQYQEKLNSSYEKKGKDQLEIITEADPQKIPDYIYKERISSAHPKKQIEFQRNIEKDELKQQKLQIEKEQQELRKKLEMKANQKEKYSLQKPNPPQKQVIQQKVEQKEESKIVKKIQNQQINKPPIVKGQYKNIEEKKNQPINQIPSPVISLHHQKDFKDHKYLKPQNQQQQKFVNQIDKTPSQQSKKIDFSRPQSAQQNKIQQSVQKANQVKNNAQVQQTPSQNQKPLINYERIKSAQYQKQKNYGNKIIYNDNYQKKPEFQVWQKQLGQKEIIAQNALELKKK